MKKIILKESQLKRVITESIKRVIMEWGDKCGRLIGHIRWYPQRDATLAVKGYTAEYIEELAENEVIDPGLTEGFYGATARMSYTYDHGDYFTPPSESYGNVQIFEDDDTRKAIEEITDTKVKEDFKEAYKNFIKECEQGNYEEPDYWDEDD